MSKLHISIFEFTKVGFKEMGDVYKSEPLLYYFGTLCIFAA